jgi:hypothetical protein
MAVRTMPVWIMGPNPLMVQTVVPGAAGGAGKGAPSPTTDPGWQGVEKFNSSLDTATTNVGRIFGMGSGGLGGYVQGLGKSMQLMAAPEKGQAASGFQLVTGAMGGIAGAAGKLMDVAVTLGSKASPSAASTLSGSFDMLQAKLGTWLVPFMNGASSLVQNIARLIPTPPPPLTQPERDRLRRERENMPLGLGRALNQRDELLAELDREDKKKQNLVMPFPSRIDNDFIAGADQRELAALESQNDQTGTEVLRTQLEVLQRVEGLLTEIRWQGDRGITPPAWGR